MSPIEAAIFIVAVVGLVGGVAIGFMLAANAEAAEMAEARRRDDLQDLINSDREDGE